MTFDLDRFKQAQDSPGGLATALAELQAGRKRSHWIWYVFPQLAGLGSSPAAMTYGLRGPAEATAYLRDSLLRERLLAAMNAVLKQLQRDPPPSLVTVMGSPIDATKLVSSMTLFREVARRIDDSDVATTAGEILESAAEQGLAECRFTRDQLLS